MPFAKYLTEFIGTFFFVFVICLIVAPVAQNEFTGIYAPIAIGCTLMIMVYMGGHVSGGHYNPAVTLACFLRGACSWIDVIPYWVSQVGGACAAAYLASFVLPPGEVDGETLSNFAVVAPGGAHSLQTAGPWIIEGLFTFALALVVLNTATSSGTKGNSFYGLAIGFTVVVAAFAGGGISGGAFNPAIGTGPNLIASFVGTEPEAYKNIPLYIGGPMAGAVLAAIVFKIQEAWVDYSAKIAAE